jgi:hypothetical protein
MQNEKLRVVLVFAYCLINLIVFSMAVFHYNRSGYYFILMVMLDNWFAGNILPLKIKNPS